MGDLLDDLYRTRLLQQAEAATSGKLVLKKLAPSTFVLDVILVIIALLLSSSTNYLSVLIFIIYSIIAKVLTKNVRVKNVATGEIFKVHKKEFKEYKKQQRNSKNEVRSIM